MVVVVGWCVVEGSNSSFCIVVCMLLLVALWVVGCRV